MTFALTFLDFAVAILHVWSLQTAENALKALQLNMSDMCEEQIVPNEFFPHHGSLAKELREVLESRLQKGNLYNSCLYNDA